MKTSFFSKLLLLITITSFIVSCKDSGPHFSIEGKISNADTTMLYLEKRGLNSIEILDSVKLDKEGNFEFTQVSLGYPEFYLLRLDNQTINLAVDSTENILVNAPKATFATDYSVEGSESSTKIKDVVMLQYNLSNNLSNLKKQFDSKKIDQEKYVIDAQNAITEYKEKALALILEDLKGLPAYFALFQKVNDFLIFDPYDKKDLRIFQAVATTWDQYNSLSPRTEHLKNFTLNILAEIKNNKDQEENMKRLEDLVTVESSDYYNIELPDINNKNISLASFKGKAIILDFTMYQADFSPAHNILLYDVYSKNKDKVEIYQVSFDADKHAWLNTAVNLPWTRVRDEKSLASDLIIKYNLRSFPSTFLLNKNGEIVKRLDTGDDIAKEVQKLF